jgi:pyruvate formate lyase activating enzyme
MTPLGRIFNVQRFSLQDGPGLRTTVFLKGCPLACAWCHNPESQDPDPVLVTLAHRCIRCRACEDAGEAAAMVEACPTGARELLGRDMAVADLVEEILRDRIFFDQSGGGATLSGGEPLAQPRFTVALLRALRARGVHTALDTCGLAGREEFLEAAALADVVLFDLKHMDDAAHRRWTGAGNGAILANLEALAQVHGQVWLRMPVVPGVNDSDENLEATARFVVQLPGVRRLDLLPYHAAGAAKFERLGRDYPLDGLQAPGPERMAELAGYFRAQGIAVGGTP